VISTIFIPLTFIVGLYGMNFSRIDPNSGKPLSLNMPELYSPYGYPVVIAVMLAIVVFLIYLFYRKGWITK
jgi:magnesium transporter